jgi:ADP-heptose:LPS heptosyltransferase
MLTLLMRTTVSDIRQERWRRFWLVARPPLKRKKNLTPVVDRYLEAAGYRNRGAEAAQPVLYLSDAEREEGRKWRNRIMQGREGRLVALFPGAMHPPKEWPIFNFAELGRLLIMRGDVPVVIPSLDRPEIAEALAEQEKEIVLSGPVESPLELAAALSAADGAIANDSGPMHVAASVGTCTVGIFGPTGPELGFAPRGPCSSHVHLGLYCSPCGKHGKRVCYRRERFCMLDIKPRDVVDKLEELFEGLKSQKHLDI